MKLKIPLLLVGVAVVMSATTPSSCWAAGREPANAKNAAAAPASRVRVLVTAITERDHSVTAAGAATQVAGVIVGGGGSSASTYLHSEVWETVRRFDAECPVATFVTNPQTPHSLTVHVDYQKVPTFFGGLTLYQLTLLNAQDNPIFITKKNYLHREIKPICKAIVRAE